MSETNFPTLKAVAEVIDTYRSSFEDGIPPAVKLYINSDKVMSLSNEINTVLKNEERKHDE